MFNDRDRMLFIQLVMVCLCSSAPMILACAHWTICSPPIIFGNIARLCCEVQNETEGSTRTWLGGPGYTTLSYNGISSNPKKYMEVTAREPFRSMLEIYDFSENDVDCDYSCSIGFHEDRHRLSLNQTYFELHPTRASTATAATLRKGHLVADVSMMKVYPEPKCTIKFQEKYYIGTTNSEKNGKFFRVHIMLDHTFETHVCKGQLIISCIVGNSDVKVHSQYFYTCPDNTAERNTSNGALDNLPYIVTVFLFVIVLVVLFLSVVYMKKTKNPVICNYCNKGDGVAVDDVKQEGRGHNIELLQKNISRENNDGNCPIEEVIDDGNDGVDLFHGEASDMNKTNDAIIKFI